MNDPSSTPPPLPPLSDEQVHLLARYRHALEGDPYPGVLRNCVDMIDALLDKRQAQAERIAALEAQIWWGIDYCRALKDPDGRLPLMYERDEANVHKAFAEEECTRLRAQLIERDARIASLQASLDAILPKYAKVSADAEALERHFATLEGTPDATKAIQLLCRAGRNDWERANTAEAKLAEVERERDVLRGNP